MGKQALEGFGSRLPYAGLRPETVVIIGHDTDDGPEHPLWDERANLPVEPEFVDDIAINGILQAIEVRKNGEILEVTFGRQRTKGARAVNERRAKAKGWTLDELFEAGEMVLLPAKAAKVDDLTAFQHQISENVHRVADNALVTASKISRFLANSGGDEKRASIIFKMPVASVRMYERLNVLIPKIRKAVEKGEISPSAAAKLADLHSDQQEEMYNNLLAEQAANPAAKPTVARATVAAKQAKNGAESAHAAPGTRLVKKVLKLNKEAEEPVLSAEFIQGAMWLLGELNPTRVKGLKGLIDKANAGKKEKEKEE